VNRRHFLRTAGAAAALAGTARASFAQDDLLETLMRQSGEPGRGGFDAASRTVRMPKASLPTLSPATVESTEQAIPTYEAFARTGWPEVPAVDNLRLGARCPAVVPLRQRMMAGGDLDVNGTMTDVYDSYVERAVRRFQARHGLNVDGLADASVIKTMNIPASARLNQLKVNLARLRAMGSSLPPRFVTCNIPAAQIEAIENGVAVTRHTAVVGKPDRPSPEINSKIV
jgi:murein L,D-transpeptidase YcbB/YkuD